MVFTLGKATIEAFEAEFHTHRVMGFAAAEARRLLLRWPGRSMALKPQENPSDKGIRWVPEGRPVRGSTSPG